MSNDNILPQRHIHLPPSDEPWISTTLDSRIILKNPEHPTQIIAVNPAEDLFIHAVPKTPLPCNERTTSHEQDQHLSGQPGIRQG